jgi:hypothetical protein
MLTRSVQGKLLVAAVFIIGIATGVLSANIYHNRVVESAKAADNRPQQDHTNPQQRARQSFDRMTSYLGLNDQQRTEIEKIIEETRSDFRELREKTDPQFKAIEETSRAKVLAVLNEDQRKKYNEFRETHPGPNGPRGRGPRPPDRDNDKNR